MRGDGGIVAMCKEFGLSRAQTADKLAERLGADADETERLHGALW